MPNLKDITDSFIEQTAVIPIFDALYHIFYNEGTNIDI